MIPWYWGLVSAGHSNPDQVLSALEVLVGGYPGGMVFKSAPSCHTEPALCVDAVGGAEQIGIQHTEH